MKTNLKLLFSLLFLIATVLPVFAVYPGNCLTIENNKYVVATGIPAYSAITVEGWVNHSNTSANIQRYFTMLNETAVLRKYGSSLDFFVKSSSGAVTHAYYPYTLTIGQWMHVAGTYDGTTVKLYVNGSLVSSNVTGGGFSTNTGEFRIGNDAESMIGKVDEVRLWNIVRTQQEIQDHRFHELSGTEPGLRSYWKFDENSGSTAIDVCGNSNGVLQNMTDANRVASTLPLSFNVSGIISTNTTWTAPTVYVTDDVTVNSGVTLTILPGVRVAFAPTKKLEIKGNLIAEGTSTNRITFNEMTPGSRWGSLTFDGTSSAPSTNSSMKYCTVERGSGGGGGYGMVYAVNYPSLKLHSTIIRDGQAQLGAGSYQYRSTVEMINCLLYNNTATNGGALVLAESNLKMSNCIVADNTSQTGGAILHWGANQPMIRNSVFWGNGITPFTGSAGFFLNNIQYCIVEGGYQGTGNIDQDPEFSGEADNPYKPSNSSVCVNAGINDVPGLELPASDLEGNPRIYDHPSNSNYNRVDIGAYEHQGYLAPNNISASDGSNLYPGYVYISWSFNPDYNIPVSGFRILRDGIVIATLSSQTYTYSDYNALVGYIHLYQVEAYYQSEAGLSVADTGCLKPNGVISGKVQTTNSNPVMGVKVSLNPSIGFSLQMNAANSSSVNIANPNVNLNSNFSLELWVNTASQNVTLLNSGNHSLSINSSGRVQYVGGSHTLIQQLTSINVADANWHHIAIVNDITNNKVLMYLDDLVVATASGYNFANYVPGNFVIPVGITGYVDDLRIWDTVRDSTEVVNAMNMVVSNNSPGLKGYWAMNEGAGNNLFDATNYAHNGVISYCTWSSNDAGMALGAITDGWGNYIITEIPYGSAITFSVIPSKAGHMFQPEHRLVTLSSSNIAANDVDFIDNSMIPISGIIRYYGTNVPVVNASIWLNGVQAIPPVVTNASGYYVLEVEHGTSCTVTAKFGNHTFSEIHNLGTVNYPRSNINFTDIFTTQLYVQVVGGRDSYPIGNFNITASHLNTTYPFETSFNTGNWESGQVVLSNLPPLNYNITITPRSGNLTDDPFGLGANTAFTKLKNIDLTNTDAEGDTLRFEWRASLEVDVAWNPDLEMKYFADYPLLGFYVLQQNVWQEVEVSAFENYNYGAYTDHISLMPNCDIEINNEVGAIPSTTANFGGENSYSYRFAPYLPNILSGGDRPYQKKLQIDVYDAETNRYATSIDWVLTEGECPQQSTYSTTSPEIPILILHDPPGDGSYASFNQSSSHSISMGVTYSNRSEAGTQVKASLGLDIAFNTGIMFSVETNLDFVADLSYGYNLSSTVVNDSTMTMTLTTTEEYQTSSQDMLIGQASDLYVGGAVNLVWGLTKRLRWIDTLNSVDLSDSLMVVPHGFDTWYIYTENQILNTVIPNLIAINDIESANRWQSFVDANTQHINNAVPNENHHSNISFNAGASYLYSETNSTETETSIIFETTVDHTFGTAIGAFVNGVGGQADFTFQTGITIGGSQTNNTQSETTISYVLSDDDETSNLNTLADYYSVDIRKDPVYGTPVFNVVGGATSNPWEPNTRPRDGVSFSANTNASHGLLEGQQAVFLLNLGNTTQNNEDRRYYLSMHHETNPGGATILINGLPLIDRMAFDIPAEQSVNAVMTVIKGPLEYSYHDLTLEFYAEGDRGNDGPDGYYFYQFQEFDVTWETPYSIVSIASPGQDWKINQASNNTLDIMLTDYDITKAKFRSLILEYKQPSSVAWSQGFEIVRDSLLTHPYYVVVPWNVSGIADGEYQIRAGATDSLSVRYYTEYIWLSFKLSG